MGIRTLVVALFTLAVVLSSASLLPAAGGPGAPAVQSPQAPPAAPMLDALRAFNAATDDDARARASFPFDGEQRLSWFYTPVERTGLPIGALDEGQLDRLQTFLRTGLGEHGTEQAFDIVALEEVLFATSGGRAMRDPGNYFLGVFGEPGASGPWGWRFEGHHLSVNFTIVDGRVVSATPAFFGGNPAVVPDDAPVNAGLSPFSREQEAAFGLVARFDGAQRDAVLVADTPPDDILTSNERRATMGAPDGVALADMSASQREALMELLGLFLARMHPDLADYQMAKAEQQGMERIHFAWAGGTEPGARHYFRIHGPSFVVEWDNTQGNGNHVHSVWRDFDDDFGYDPLGEHLAADHGVAIPGLEPRGANERTADTSADAHARAHAREIPHRHH